MSAKQLSLPLNRVRVTNNRPSWRWRPDALALLGIVLATLSLLVLAFSATPSFRWDDLGKPEGARYRQSLYLQNFYESEEDTNDPRLPWKHWSKPEAAVSILGLGRGWYETTLVLNGQRPEGPPATVTLGADGTATTVQLAAQPRRYTLLVPAATGDFKLGLQSQGFVPPVVAGRSVDERQLGVILNHLAITPLTTTPLPPQSTWWALLGTLLVAYGAMRLSGVVPRWAVVLPLLILIVLAVSLRLERPALGLLLPRLFGGALVGLVAVGLIRLLWPPILRLGRLEAPPWLLPSLLAIFLVGYAIKMSGVLHPYTVTIDVPWHMQRTREILSGRLPQLYQPGAFSRSVMPLQEWGENPPLIPYSPFFHMFATVFALFPWKLETSANIFSVLVDTSRPFLIAALALRFGFRARAALLAALLYAITPFPFLLHSWGNIPTTFGMWWTLVATTVIALGYDRLREPKVFGLLLLVLLATLLFYTVMAVFMGVFVCLLVLGLLLWGKGGERRSARLIAAALVGASVLSLVIYYGQYIPPMIRQTLPYITNTVVSGQQTAGQDVITPWGEYLSNFRAFTGYNLLGLWFGHEQRVLYGIQLPLLLGLPGLWLLRRNRVALLIMGAWVAVGVLFFMLGTRVSMVDKHTFYLAPALMITTGAVLDRVWQRWRWSSVFITLAYSATFWAAMQLWLLRLIRVSL